ncbi:MAG: leucine-rich repeat protein [Eubacterium sp.]|nr:leucine-rich repeat protein [Eubacterium sp.]
MKRVLSVILSLIMLASLAPLYVYAEGEQSGSYEDKMTWSYSEDTKTLRINCDGELDFPYNIKYEEFYDMGELQKMFIYKEYPWHVGGFYKKVEHVELSGNITAIGEYVFYGFSNLSEITIPETVTRLGQGVFNNCSKITQLVVPDGVKSIGEAAFANMNALKSIKLPDGLEDLGGYAFSYTRALTDLTLPENITRIGPKLFGSFVSYAIDNGIAHSEGGVIYIGKYALECTSHSENVVIKEGTQLIADKLFLFASDSGFTITLPQSLRYIGAEAFKYSRATEIVIPDGVVSIGEGAFSGVKLKRVNIPSSLKVIEKQVFYNTDLEGVTIPKGITRIAADAFDGAPLKAISVDRNNANYCSVGGVLFNKNKTSLIIYPKAKEGKHYSIPNTVTTLYTSFDGKLETVAFPKSVKNCYKRIRKTIYYFGTEEEFNKINIPPKNPYDYYDRITVKCCKAKLSKTKYTYNGKVQTPKIKVYDPAGNLLKEKKDYTVKLPKGRKKINFYTVKITLKGRFKGSYKLTYRIAPKGTQITKLKPGTAKLTAKWKKQPKSISGYEVQFCDNSDFSKGWARFKKTYTVKKNKTSTTAKDLSVDKTYYVRVRTFKTVNKKRVYSSWSKAQKAKVKSPY